MKTPQDPKDSAVFDPITFRPTFTTWLGPAVGYEGDVWTAQYEVGEYVKAARGYSRAEAMASLFRGLAELYEIDK